MLILSADGMLEAVVAGRLKIELASNYAVLSANLATSKCTLTSNSVVSILRIGE